MAIFIYVPLTILILWYLYRYHRSKLTAPKLFNNNLRFIQVNIILFFIAGLANFKLDQLFCTPVTWVTVMLLAFITTFLTVPLNIKLPLLKYLQAIVLGGGIFILLYVIVFASDEYLTIVLFLTPFTIPFDIAIRYIQKRYNNHVFDVLYIFPLILLTPYFLLFQLVRYYLNLSTKRLKLAFIISPIVVLIIGVGLSFRINYLTNKFNSVGQDPTAIVALLNNPVDEYLGELILGAHWKYHTELCMYDGTRPPLHDPVLGFAHMLNLHTGVCCYHENLMLYTKVFPGRNTTINCQCSY